MKTRPFDRRGIFSLAVLLFVVHGESVLMAAITTFTDEASFVSQLQAGYYLENFNGQTGGSHPSGLSLSGGTGNAFAYNINDNLSGGVYVFTPSGTMPSGWPQGSAVSPNAGTSLVITFTSGNVTAVGGYFFQTTFAGAFASGTVTATLNDGSHVDATSSSGSVGFAGFTSDGASITSLTLSPGANFATMDNFYVGQLAAVPEAGGWVAAGFLGIFVVGRSGFIVLRRSRQATWQQ